MNRLTACVACGSTAWSVKEIRNHYELAVCSSCGLRFTVNADYNIERYQAGYEGTSDDTSLPKTLEFVYVGPQLRLETEGQAYFRPPPRLTPAERMALQWLQAHVPPTSTVVECGCGTGRFLKAMQNVNLSGVGVEVSNVTVQLLNQAGLKAIYASAPDFPWQGADPAAIAFFEVMEHLPEPRTILEPLRKRFPRTVIIGSVPSPLRWPATDNGPADSPPHHYLAWTPKALEKFFVGIGYSKVHVQMPKPVGYEQMPSCGEFLSRFAYFRRKFSGAGAPKLQHVIEGSTTTSVSIKRRIVSTGKIWSLWAYQHVINILGASAARRGAKQGGSAASLFFVAEP